MMDGFLNLADLLEKAAAALRAASESLRGIQPVKETPIAVLNLSVRARKGMDYGNVHTVEHLVKLTVSDLLGFRNFGECALREVQAKLAGRGLALRGELPPSNKVSS